MFRRHATAEDLAQTGPDVPQDAPETDIPSLFAPGRNCWRVAHAARAAFVIDAAAYFDAFGRACLQAQRDIIIVGWDFNSRTRLWPERGPDGVPAVLGDFLNYLVRRRRRLRIHVLNWDFPMIYGANREFIPMFSEGWRHHHRIQMRFDDSIPVGSSHHQKMVVIDDALAFVGGIDLTKCRWDTPQHLAQDPRRVNEDGSHYIPFHDMMMAVDGEAARAVGELCRERWQRATGHALRPVLTRVDPWPATLTADVERVGVALARTAPAYRGTPELREVENLYLDAIAAAQRFIYIENQYFTSRRVGEALGEALQRDDGPEIVIVLRPRCDGWLEGPTMGALCAALLKQLREADRHQRLRVLYPVVPGLGPDEFINVHAKLMIVDDRLARIGSANLNNRSMGLDTECDLALEARGDERVSEAVKALRNRLLAEHLGTTPEEVDAAVRAEDSLIGAIEQLRRSDRPTFEPFEPQKDWPAAWGTVAELLDMERPVALNTFVSEMVGPAEPTPRRRLLPMLVATVLLLGALYAMWQWTPLKEFVTVEAITAIGERYSTSPLAPLLVVFAYVLASVTLFPRPLLTLAVIIIFGAGLGAAYALGGIVLSALANYAAGRMMSRDTVRRLAGERVNRLTRELSQRGFVPMLIARMLPIAPFLVVNLVAGAFRIRVLHFTLATLIGMAPGVLAMTVFGQEVQNALQSGEVNWWLLATVTLLLLLVSYFLRRWYQRRNQRDAGAARTPAVQGRA